MQHHQTPPKNNMKNTHIRIVAVEDSNLFSSDIQSTQQGILANFSRVIACTLPLFLVASKLILRPFTSRPTNSTAFRVQI